MKLDGARLPALMDDLEVATREARAAFADDPAGWALGPAGKWTAGQHLAHVAVTLAHTADEFEAAAAELAAGRLARRPWRDPLQALAIRVLTRDKFPRGGKTASFAEPGPTPSREQVFAGLEEGVARHRKLADRVSPADCDRLWIRNPFAARLKWHYLLPEMVRVHTTHLRHHVRMAREAAASSAS